MGLQRHQSQHTQGRGAGSPSPTVWTMVWHLIVKAEQLREEREARGRIVWTHGTWWSQMWRTVQATWCPQLWSTCYLCSQVWSTCYLMSTGVEYMLPDVHRCGVYATWCPQIHSFTPQRNVRTSRYGDVNQDHVTELHVRSKQWIQEWVTIKKYRANFTISQGRNKIMSLQNYPSLIPDLFDS